MVIPLLAIPKNIILYEHKTYSKFYEFNNVLNFKNENNQIFGIANSFVPYSPFNFVVSDGHFELIKKSKPNKIKICNISILIENFNLILTSYTKIWSPYLNFKYERNSQDFIWKIFEYFCTIANNQGLSVIFKIINNEKILGSTENYKIAKIIFENFYLIVKEPFKKILTFEYLKNIIGLGAGLTPAGDDFIIGVICASHFFGFQKIKILFNDILKVAKKHTNLISFNYIKAAINKIFSKDIIEFLFALNYDYDEHICYSALDKITKMGHTSGVDFLAGFFTTLMLFGGQTDETC